MKDKLITVSLINSVEWLSNAPNSLSDKNDPSSLTWKQKAIVDLKNMLTRNYQPMGKEAQKGVDFENYVNPIMKHGLEIKDLNPSIMKIISHCKDGKQQQKTRGIIEIDGIKYFLSGKMDYLFPNKIVDLKTTAKFDMGKYLDSVQHDIYCYNQQIADFEYIIAVWDDVDQADPYAIADVKVIPITVDLTNVGTRISNRIKNCLEILQANEELWTYYTEKFCY